jgi:hypothetical protein
MLDHSWNYHGTFILKGANFTEQSEINLCVKSIAARSIPAGGFCENQNGVHRPDSTAWAVLALAKSGQNASFADSGRISLVANQLV